MLIEKQRVSLNDDLNDKEDLIEALSIVAQLYTDKTHLVYELLQNAEDCVARRVKFIMYSDRLEFIHDGEPFTQQNLTSIRRIGKTTKDSLNTIGKFGVGFKSVFCVCKEFWLYSSPDNYECDSDKKEKYLSFAHRVIDFRYIDEKNPIENLKLEEAFTTKFIFPFCVDERYSGFKTFNDLYNSLSDKLSELGCGVLLFLKNLKSIEYVVHNQEGSIEKQGKYLLEKRDIGNGCIEISTAGASNDNKSGHTLKNEEKKYLLYSKPVEKLENKKTVDIAFAFSNYDTEGVPVFEKLNNQTITVYFPTERESKLNFIVQGPYATPPHRGDVPENDEDNKMLADLTAKLLQEAILDLKKRNWINLEFIDLLPYKPIDNKSWLFKPLQDVFKKLLRTEGILPTIDSSYVIADNAKIADSADLAEIFAFPILGDLFANPDYRWLPTSLTDTNPIFGTLYNFFKKEFKKHIKSDDDINWKEDTVIKEIAITTIGSELRKNNIFLHNRSDEWLKKFYHYLLSKRPGMLQPGERNSFSTVPFIKTIDNRFVEPYSYDPRTKQYVSNIFIKPTNTTFLAKKFKFANELVPCEILDKLSIKEPDEYDYYIQELKSNNKDVKDDISNIKQVKKAIKYLREEREGVQETLKTLLLLKVKDTFGNSLYKKAESFISNERESLTPVYIYFQHDVYDKSIEKYFNNLKLSLYILDETFYLNNGLTKQDIDQLKAIGIKNSIVEMGENEWKCGAVNCKNLKSYKHHLTITNIDKVLLYIENYEENYNSKEKSEIILSLLEKVKGHIKGQWQEGKSSPTYKDSIAPIINQLKSKKWLYSNKNKLVKSNDITPNDLNKEIYSSIDKKSTIFEFLNFKDDIYEQTKIAINEFEKKYGTRDLESLLKEYLPKEDEGEFDPKVREEDRDFPNEPIKNLDRLLQTINEEYQKAGEVKYEHVIRSVRTSRGMDKEHIGYRYKGFCQMCEKPSRYWEVAQIFNEPKKEIAQMNLSLCPTCASKYRLMRNDKDKMKRLRNNIYCSGFNAKIAVDDEYLTFTQAHLAEIQEILRIESKQK